jgi:hypothetical protein
MRHFAGKELEYVGLCIDGHPIEIDADVSAGPDYLRR